MSVLIFLGVLFVLILVHEWGHYITAKKTGMRVDEFGIGFPPKLWSIKKGETVYSLNALPIGGFVKILGENGVDGDTLSEADQARTFAARPKWAQAVVLIAGVTMNILLAWLLFSVTFMIGVPTEVSETDATDASQLYVANTMAESPASVLPLGSSIVGAQSGELTLERLSPAGISEFVAIAAPATISVSYEYGGQIEAVDITPVQGLIADDPERYVIGAQTALVEVQSRGPVAAVIEGFRRTYNGLIAVTVGLVTFLTQAITGTADYSQVAGPVGIVGLVGDAAAIGLVTLLNFTAFISLNLAVINMLPVPALDGGRLLFVAAEAATGKKIPDSWAGYMNGVGMLLLLLLMAVVTFNDISNLIG